MELNLKPVLSAKDVTENVVRYSRQYLTLKFLFWGALYSTTFHGLWYLSTQLETVVNTVSWYLPAGLRLAAFIIAPYRSWPMLIVCEKVLFYVLFSPNAALDKDYFFSGSVGWYLVHFIAAPCVIMAGAWVIKRKFSAPYIASVESTISFLIYSLIISMSFGLLFLGRKAFEGSQVSQHFWSTLFEFTLGDIVGILVLSPLLLLLSSTQRNGYSSGLALSVSMWLLTLVVSHLFLTSGFDFSYHLKHLAILPALFLAYRYAIVGAAFSNLLIGITAFVASIDSDVTPLEHQFYVIAMSISSLILGAATYQTNQMQRRLELSNDKINAKNTLLTDALDNIHRLTNQLISSQEDERKRLSRDLHDDFGHRIVELQLQLSLAKTSSSPNFTFFDNLSDKLDALHHAMKKSIGKLRPHGIDTLPIEEVIRNSDIIKSAKRLGLKVEIDAKGSIDALPYTLKINTYRIIQEALTNIIKHADASLVKIQLDYGQSNLAVTIQDNGVGFEQPSAPSSLGVVSMHERARLMGCELLIASNSAGTTISFNAQIK